MVDRKGKKQIDVEHISLKTSFLIGLSQALAIIPGVSRSGITMTTALALGMTREGAARFSFLLSAPIILGAALVKMPEVIANPSMIDASFLTGMAVSCISGLLAIGFLLRYVQTKTFLPFVVYRFILGVVVIGVAWFQVCGINSEQINYYKIIHHLLQAYTRCQNLKYLLHPPGGTISVR
ncbi:MAG: undecaprenyl-diphosphate phosphatase [Desulfobacterales bacterium]|nr:undecaprenyl-diphosphate phosphatase [Desulfobacterales bacterium]